jgi:hypothetical protein
VAGKQIHHHAFMSRIEVLDQNKGHAGLRRQRGYKFLTGIEAAG